MCPGIEVTAKDANGDGTADGDVLGYKMPSANPTNIDNLSMTSANLVSAIHAANTNAAVFAAHPDGGLGAGNVGWVRWRTGSGVWGGFLGK